MTTSNHLTSKLDTLFNFLPIGVYRMSPEGHMLMANQALVEMLGFISNADLMAADRHGLYPYIDPNRRITFRHLLNQHGKVQRFVSEIEHPFTHKRMWIAENAHAVCNDEGHLIYYEGTVENITEQENNRIALENTETMFKLITSHLPGAVYIVELWFDGRKKYHYISSGVKELYEIESEQAIFDDPKLIKRLRHPDDHIDQDHIKAQVIKQSGELTDEWRLLMPDGRIKWVFGRSIEIRRNEHAVMRIGTLIDITQRKQIEAELLKKEAVWKLALEAAGDGVWDWNIRDQQGFVSDGIRNIMAFGDDPSDNLGQELDDNIHPEDRPQVLRDRQAHFDGLAASYRNEHRVRNRKGEWRWVRSRGMVIERAPDGSPIRMIGTHTDITDQKFAQATQKLLEDQLRESQKMEAIGTLAGGVAHDFNNLLTVILGNVKLAQLDISSQHPAFESIAEIRRVALHAQNVVKQILAYSRKQPTMMRHLCLNDLLQETLVMLRPMLSSRKMQLVAHIQKEPIWIHADSTQLNQVMMNLCNNAVQAMPDHGTLTINVLSVELTEMDIEHPYKIPPGRYACIEVQDTGHGIDIMHMNKIFDPFFSTKPQGEGTGLGLSVVQGIIQSHKGFTQVESLLGQGANFAIYLPILQENTTSNPQTLTNFQLSQYPHDLHEMQQVVYVDDFLPMITLAKRLMYQEGLHVLSFTTAKAAWEWICHHPDQFDALITDYNIPEMTGIELAEKTRQLQPKLPIVIVSGFVTEQLRAKAAQLDVQAVYQKQECVEDLGIKIKGIIHKMRKGNK